MWKGSVDKFGSTDSSEFRGIWRVAQQKIDEHLERGETLVPFSIFGFRSSVNDPSRKVAFSLEFELDTEDARSEAALKAQFSSQYFRTIRAFMNDASMRTEITPVERIETLGQVFEPDEIMDMDEFDIGELEADGGDGDGGDYEDPITITMVG